MNHSPGIGNMTLYGLEKAAVSAKPGRIRGNIRRKTIREHGHGKFEF